jgi:hypothetical protein
VLTRITENFPAMVTQKVKTVHFYSFIKSAGSKRTALLFDIILLFCALVTFLILSENISVAPEAK